MGGTLKLQQPLAHRPALIQRAYHIVFSRDRVLEQRFVERGVAADQADRPHRHARLIHVDKHQADALVLGRLGIGADEGEDKIRLDGIRGPQLATVDDVMITAQFRFAGQIRQVRSRAGLGIAHTPSTLATRARGQPACFLFVGAELENGGADVVHAATG